MTLLNAILGIRSRHQEGFTLVELLITVGIIVALAAVIVPLVIQFAGKGDEGAWAAEAAVVQAAVDTMMADNKALAITERLLGDSAAIEPGDTFGILGGDTFEDYMRMDGLDTECSYYWNGQGSIIQDPTKAPCIP